jgi:hypothetical protein
MLTSRLYGYLFFAFSNTRMMGSNVTCQGFLHSAKSRNDWVNEFASYNIEFQFPNAFPFFGLKSAIQTVADELLAKIKADDMMHADSIYDTWISQWYVHKQISRYELHHPKIVCIVDSDDIYSSLGDKRHEEQKDLEPQLICQNIRRFSDQ